MLTSDCHLGKNDYISPIPLFLPVIFIHIASEWWYMGSKRWRLCSTCHRGTFLHLCFGVVAPCMHGPTPIRETISSLFSYIAGEDELKCILDDLSEVKADCYKIGICLHLKQSDLDSIKLKNNDFVEAMTEIISNWLKLNYNYQKFGKPTWKALVDAVGSPIGGNNTGLAEEIAKRHQR